MATSTPSPPPPPSLPPSPPPPPPPPPPLSSPQPEDHQPPIPTPPQPPLSPPPDTPIPPPPQSPSSPPLDPDENPIPNREDQPGSSVAPPASPPSSPSTQLLSSPQTTAAGQNPNPELQILEAAPIQVPHKKKAQSMPWTHQETANLILAYQEKWYSLKKGQLKASQWEEVAITVAARCNYDEPSKSATQCRHKIEKLRKRYREERGKPRARENAWSFFKLMDNLERGPLPISASPPMPMGLLEYPDSVNSSSDSDFQVKKKKKKIKKSSSKRKSANRIGDQVIRRGLRTPTLVRKREDIYDEEEGNGGDEQGFNVSARMAVEVRSFADRFLQMEGKKIEMMKDTVRCRMEMENKKMQMILENQQKLVEIVHKAFNNSSKKLRV